MTLENLIKIVAEAVEKILLLEKMNVLGIVFDEKNKKELRQATESINQKATLLSPTSASTLDLSGVLPDVLFLDYIPIEVVSDIALGQRHCPLTNLISDMLLAGRKVFVLGYQCIDKSPIAYQALFKNYYQMIASYGVLFPENRVESKQHTPHQVYSGNVLSVKELLEYTQAGEITITNTVIVTNLAADEAKKRNIKINLSISPPKE